MNKRCELMRSMKPGRTLFAVDIENAVGSGMVVDGDCLAVRKRIEREYKLSGEDLVVIGVSHSGNVFSAHAWRSARVVMRKGRDGADLALESVLSSENVEGRFSRVVIVSGDGLFAKEAARLKQHGVKVVVDARACQLSRGLAHSCSVIKFAPERIAA